MPPIATSHDQILAFTQRYPAACFHTIDMPYRLASPAAQEPVNCRVWTDSNGEVTGFGVIQLPFSTVDWGVRPGSEELHKEIVQWGVARLEDIARQRGEGFGYLLDSRSDHDPIASINGFSLDDWHIRNLAMGLVQAPTAPSVPPGFTIRQLNGEGEVAAYVDLHRAAFQSRNMSIEWRIKTLSQPGYRPELDLVVEAPAGQLVAFCIGWLGELQGQLCGQIEPIGVLPDFQRRGLGSAILLTALQAFAKIGAKRVFVDAESYNDASQFLYESTGFQEVALTYKYFRRF